jgi:hypothetical protein
MPGREAPDPPDRETPDPLPRRSCPRQRQTHPQAQHQQQRLSWTRPRQTLSRAESPTSRHSLPPWSPTENCSRPRSPQPGLHPSMARTSAWRKGHTAKWGYTRPAEPHRSRRQKSELTSRRPRGQTATTAPAVRTRLGSFRPHHRQSNPTTRPHHRPTKIGPRPHHRPKKIGPRPQDPTPTIGNHHNHETRRPSPSSEISSSTEDRGELPQQIG